MRVSSPQDVDAGERNGLPAWVNFASGGAAGVSGWLFVHVRRTARSIRNREPAAISDGGLQPMDVCKTRMQLGGSASRAAARILRLGRIDVVMQVEASAEA